MCYNNCQHFSFNPIDDTDKCTKGSRPCPEELPLSACCAAELPDWPDSSICPDCKEHTGIEEEE